VATKRSRKRSWLRSLLIFIFTPLIIWFFAFVIWFYWSDISRLLSNAKEPSKTSPKTLRKNDQPDRPETAAEKRAQEKILDEDRKQLEDILKKQKR
jgi:predicted PurR-regulated permease PerM